MFFRIGNRSFAKYLETVWSHYLDDKSFEGLQTNSGNGDDKIHGALTFSDVAATFERGLVDADVCIAETKDAMTRLLCGCMLEADETELAGSLAIGAGHDVLYRHRGAIRTLTDQQVQLLCSEYERIELAEFLVRLVIFKIIKLGDVVDRRRDIDPWVQIFAGIVQGGKAISR